MHERPPAWSGQCIPSALGNERVCSCLHTDEWGSVAILSQARMQEDMSALGQKQTFAVQHPMSALGQKRTHAAQQKGVLFDHFVGGYEQSLGHSDAQRPGGLDVNYKIELTWLLDRDVGRLRSAQDLVHKIGGTPKQLLSTWSIVYQSPSPDRVSEPGHRWNPCGSRQLCNRILIGIGQRIDANIEDITAALESLNGIADIFRFMNLKYFVFKFEGFAGALTLTNPPHRRCIVRIGDNRQAPQIGNKLA